MVPALVLPGRLESSLKAREQAHNSPMAGYTGTALRARLRWNVTRRGFRVALGRGGGVDRDGRKCEPARGGGDGLDLGMTGVGGGLSRVHSWSGRLPGGDRLG
jgi:hypothetical protein